MTDETSNDSSGSESLKDSQSTSLSNSTGTGPYDHLRLRPSTATNQADSESRRRPRLSRRTLLIAVAVITVCALVASGLVAARFRSRAADAGIWSREFALVPGGLACHSGGTASTVAGSVPLDDIDWRRFFETIACQVESIRGLSLKTPIVVKVANRTELNRLWDERRHASGIPIGGPSRATLRFMRADGHVENSDGKRDDPYAGGILGFYSRSTNQLALLYDSRMDRFDYAHLFAHEYTHALVAQALPPKSSWAEAADSRNDAWAAQEALAEADADAVVDEYRQRYGRPASPIDWDSYLVGELSGLKSHSDKIWVLIYFAGERFVDQLRHRGGWQAVNDAEANPPNSTSEVMHIDRFHSRSVAASVDVTGLAVKSGAGPEDACVARDEGRLGEFGLAAVLASQLEATPAIDASDGWDGDGYTFQECSKRSVFAAQFVGTTEHDAIDIESAWRQWTGKWRTLALKDLPGDAASQVSGTVRRSGNAVNVMLSAPRA